MSRFYDLFCEGSQKCHPGAFGDSQPLVLGRCSCDAVKRVSLAFDSLSARGVRMNLAVGTFYGGLRCVSSAAVGHPNGPLSPYDVAACYHASVLMRGFYHDYKNHR
jgi:hypothetical protein